MREQNAAAQVYSLCVCVRVQQKQLRCYIFFFSVMCKRTLNVYPVADESPATPILCVLAASCVSLGDDTETHERLQQLVACVLFAVAAGVSFSSPIDPPFFFFFLEYQANSNPPFFAAVTSLRCVCSSCTASVRTV